MEWIRGGTWEFDECHDLGPIARLRREIPREQSLFASFPERKFLSNPAIWQARIGDAYQLERYAVQAPDARRLFERFRALSDGTDEHNPFYDEWTEQGPVIDGLLALLHDFGPLDSVRGVIDVTYHGPHGTPEILDVQLHLYYLSVKSLAGHFFDAVDHRLPTYGLSHVRNSLHNEMSFVVKDSNTGMRSESYPLTLRAFLWLSIFMLDDRPHEELCTFCKKRFDVPVKRGPRFTYCELHRADKFKKMVSRNTAERWLEQNQHVVGSV